MSSILGPHQSLVYSSPHLPNSPTTFTAHVASPVPQATDSFLGRDSLDPYDDKLARSYSHPLSQAYSPAHSHTHKHSRVDLFWESALSLSASPLYPREPHRLWERRRVQRWRAVETCTLALIAAWTVYTSVRYFIAFAMYRSPARRTLSLALGVASLVALSLSLVLASSKPVLGQFVRIRPHLLHACRIAAHFARAGITLLTIGPAIVNLVLVYVWRKDGDPAISLYGRCKWDIDVDWTAGVGSRCESPVWGVWLAAAIARLVITAVALVAYHGACAAHNRARRSMRTARPDANEHLRSLALAPSQPIAFALQSRDSMSVTTPAPLHPFPSPRRPLWERRSSSNFTLNADHPTGSQTSFSREESLSAQETRLAPSSVSSHTPAGQSDLLSAQDLQNFTDSFRNVVGQVSRDLAEGRLSPAIESPRTPPLHSVMSTHTPYVSLDEFGRPIPPHESVAVFGRTVRRMPTIESMGTFATSPSPEASPRSPGAGSMFSSSSRAPTRMSMATMMSVASAPSRSNSLSQGLAQPRDTLRVANDLSDYHLRLRPLSTSSIRPISTSSIQTALTNASGSNSNSGSGSGTGLSRSNSVNAVDVLTPVDEHEITPVDTDNYRTASPNDYEQVVRESRGRALTDLIRLIG